MAAASPSDPALARRVLALAASRQPTLGAGRLVCVDGLAGSGKTTLARTLARAVEPRTDCRVLHLDAMYPGWRGLDQVAEQVDPLLRDLAAGRTGRYRRWDWHADQLAEEVPVTPVPLLVLEGVGAGQRAWADLATVVVWLEADRETRLERAVARDGEGARAHLVQWQADEDALLARERTDLRADLVIGTA